MQKQKEPAWLPVWWYPSTIDTPQNRKAMPDADVSAWVKPEAIAAAIYFYCTPDAAALREPVIRVYNNG